MVAQVPRLMQAYLASEARSSVHARLPFGVARLQPLGTP